MKPRLAVQRMDAYQPASFGRDGFLRLDSNENTTGCSPRVLKAITKSLTRDIVATYPEYEEARSKLAAAFGRTPAETLMTNGIDDAILLLMVTFVDPGARVILAEPCFSMYRFYAALADAQVVNVRRTGKMQFPLAEVRREAEKGASAILVDNPNNPTGTAIAPQQLAALARDFPSTVVLVDEAYYDFYGQTALPYIDRHPNLVVTRTFSKSHGLAGLRFGVLFTQAETAGHLRKAHSPYSVNCVALTAACAAVHDQAAVDAYAKRVVEARNFFEAELRDVGIAYFPSSANFVLANFGQRATAVKAGLRERGILVSDRSYELPGCLRITIGTLAQMRRTTKALRALAPRRTP
jgi:histidinol-phosphate aminotransferase